MAVAKAAVAVDWNAYFWVTHKIEKSGYTHGPNRDYAEKELEIQKAARAKFSHYVYYFTRIAYTFNRISVFEFE